MENMNIPEKKRALSFIQSSGLFTLGNYVGALKNWKNMQDDFDCIFGIADLHAITVRQEPQKLRQQIYSAAATLLSIGLDPEKSIIFMQSHVAAHSQLAWLLDCYTQFGELSRMTQIARDIAERFNGIYGDVFKIPEAYIPKVGAKIMSLQDPEKKMSKSDENENARVGILDKPEDIMRKFKRAVTDSEARVCIGENKPGVNNLIGIYSAVTGKTADEITAEFEGKGYGDFKTAVGEAVVEELRPVRENYERYISDKATLEEIYRKGAERAERLANKTLYRVMKKIGYVL